jgi:ribosomal protein L29
VMKKELFGNRMKNYTGQLDDTSLLNKTRKDIARIEQILGERGRAQGAAASGGSES